MKAHEIMTLEHALFWARSGKRRKVQYEYDDGYWDGSEPEMSIYVNDRDANVSGHLPVPFTGDIDKLLCEREQERINDQIVNLVAKLERSKRECI